jgi:hypothetical protein
MNKLIVCLIFLSGFTYAQDIPNSWLKLNKNKQFNTTENAEEDISLVENKIDNIITTHNRIITRLSEKYPRLDRLDIGLGVNSSGSLGLFSFGKSKAIELIWKKNEVQKSESNEKVINLNPYAGVDAYFQQMKVAMEEVINFSQIKNRIKKKIIKTLYRDAKKVNAFVRTLYATPQVGSWYISGFWRNYYFSSSFGILDSLNLGHEKRIRFRFNILTTPFELAEKKHNKFIHSVFNTLNMIQLRDNLSDGLDLYRCRASIDYSIGFDLFFFSKSIQKGFLVEFKKNTKNTSLIETNDRLHHRLISKVTNKMNSIIATKELDAPNLSLNQVRYSFSLAGELDFVLASFEKETTLDLHFKRNNSFDMQDKKKKKIVNSDSKYTSLKQIDYRNRLNFSFGIPYINRIRLRPSIEYRYRTK